MKCPACGADVSSVLASAGGKALAKSLTKRQRVIKARKAGKANTGPRAKSETRAESMRAHWASKQR